MTTSDAPSEIRVDPDLVAFCGLYCGACGKFLKGRCPGCRKNASAAWCRVRSCCLERAYGSCADCTTHAEVRECGHFHNWISRLIGFFLGSDRRACIQQIRKLGREGHARDMAANRRQTLPRR